MFSRSVAAMAIALAAGFATGAAAQPRAIATTGMIADVAGGVAGDCVAVEAMMGPGIDPHLYQASAGDVRDLQQAAIILYNGHSLEGQLGAVFARLGERKPTVAVAERAVTDALIRPAETDYPDPHIWMDAGLWARTPPVIAAAFAAIAPDCAEAMAARAQDLAARLRALDGWIAASVASIPGRNRVLVTAHDAFAYYGRAYGIEVIGVQGISTDAEAGIADIQSVVETVVAREVPAIFVESTISPRTVRAVIEAAADRGHALTLGGELFSDAMGEAGTAAGTYIGMLHRNTVNIVRALGGTPAPLPDALAPWAARWGIEG